jgi:PAS domain S-box-containing protein
MGLATSLLVETSFKQQIQENLEKDARFGADATASKLDAILSSIRSVSSNDLVINALVDTEAREAYVPLYFNQLRIAGFNTGSRVSFTDYRGRLIASNWSDAKNTGTDWIESVIDNGQEYIRFNENGGFFAVPVFYEGTSEGAIIVEVSGKQLAKSMALSLGSNAIVIRSTSGELYSSQKEFAKLFDHEADETQGWFQSATSVSGYPDVKIIVAKRKIAALAAVYELERSLYVTITLALMALVVGIFSAAYLTTSPLSKFAAELKQISDARDLDRRIEPEGAREFHELATSFNSMLERLKKTVVSHEHLSNENDNRIKAEQEILNREARTRAIVDTSLEGIITIDSKGIIESFNSAATAIFGYLPKEVIGENVKMLMPDPDRSAHDGYLQHYVKTGTPSITGIIGTAREVTGLRKNGSTFPMDLAVSPMSIDGKKMFTGMVRDITDRKKAEDALQEQNERFNVAMENMTHGVCVFDKQSRLVVCNERYATMYGLSTDFVKPGRTTLEIAQQRIAKGIYAGEAPEDYVQDRITWGQDSGSDSKFHELSDGRTIRISRQPISDGGWVTTHEDITAIKRMEQVEREQNERFNVALDNMSHGLCVFDNEQRLVVCNERYATMYCLSPDQVLPGTSLSEIVKLRIANGFYAGESPEMYIEERRKWGQDSGKREKIQHFSDGRIIRVSRDALSDGGWVATHEDITESKRMERLKNEFVSVVSHELRTPLTSLSGSLSLLNSDAMGALPDKAKSLLDIADRNTKRLALLVNDILDMEKIKSDSMDFNLALTDTLVLAQWAIDENSAYGLEHGVSFRLKQDVESANAMVDENRMMQVLANLLSNAAKFSSPGSEVILRISKVGGKLRYAVIDTGCGIPKDKQSLLFERFFQIDGSDTRSKQGTGLGLAIVKAIIENHGGQIQVESEVGKGSTFFFDLDEVEAPIEVESGLTKAAETIVA